MGGIETSKDIEKNSKRRAKLIIEMNDPDDKNPLVSVCLLTYNRAHYLPGVIDSWLAQTYKNFELVISNDASTDNTDAICKEYKKKDSRIRYFKQEKNLNLPTNYKFALNQARGKYCILASDDDLWDKRFLEDCLNVYRAHPEFVLVFAQMVDVDARTGKEIKRFDPAKYMPFGESAYERLKAYTLFYFEDGKNQQIFGLWKREAILDDPLFGPYANDDYPPYYWGGDNYFIFRNIAKGPIGFVPNVRFFRRVNTTDDPPLRPRHQFLIRPLLSAFHRLGKVFGGIRFFGHSIFKRQIGTPYFWYIIGCVWNINKLSFVEKLKLTAWNFYVMARVFFVRKI